MPQIDMPQMRGLAKAGAKHLDTYSGFQQFVWLIINAVMQYVTAILHAREERENVRHTTLVKELRDLQLRVESVETRVRVVDIPVKDGLPVDKLYEPRCLPDDIP